ncbi:hypothetical protein [Streptosporangium sp. NPDC049078]|uniref:hypothetical protein n=1 Tax=Streptosporangium sp. NPDC049078 TaxID=3155767 RepID=UPI00341E9B6E
MMEEQQTVDPGEVVQEYRVRLDAAIYDNVLLRAALRKAQQEAADLRASARPVEAGG